MRLVAVVLSVLIASSTAAAQPQPTVHGDSAAWKEVSAALQTLASLKSYRMRMVPPPGTQHADQMNMVMEIVNPGRLHFLLSLKDMMDVEMIRVGKELRRKITLQGEMANAVQARPSLGDQIFGGGIFGVVQAFVDPVGFAVSVVTNIVMSAIMEKMMPQVPKFGVWTCEEGGGSESSSHSSPTEVTIARLGETIINGEKTQGYDMTVTGQDKGRSTTTRMRLYVLADRQVPRRMDVFDTAGKLQGSMEYSDYDAPIAFELPKCDQ